MRDECACIPTNTQAATQGFSTVLLLRLSLLVVTGCTCLVTLAGHSQWMTLTFLVTGKAVFSLRTPTASLSFSFERSVSRASWGESDHQAAKETVATR